MLSVIKTDGGFIALEAAERELITDAGAVLEERDCPSEDALIEQCRNAAALIVLREPVTERVLARLESCRIVARLGVGVDTVDLAAASARGIVVTNVPGANSHEVATHALAMALALMRRLLPFDTAARAGRWRAADAGGAMHRLDRMTLGVVGLGRTGSRLASMAAATGLAVIGVDPSLTAAEIRTRGARPVEMPDLLASADVVSLHLPLTAETHHIIDRAAIAAMKPRAMVVNVARGGLVDEDALASALAEGRLSGAALDTFELEPLPASSALIGLENVILTPHAAHYSLESVRETVQTACEEVVRVLRGEEPRHRVN